MDAQENLFSRAYRRPRVLHLPWTIKFEGMGHWKSKGRGPEKNPYTKQFTWKKIHTAGTGRETYIQAKKKKKHAHQVNQNIIYTITRRVELTSPHLFLLFPNCPFVRRNLLLTTDGFVDTSAIWLVVSFPSLQLKKVSLHMMMSKPLCYLQRCFVELCQNENTFYQRSGKFNLALDFQLEQFMLLLCH